MTKNIFLDCDPGHDDAVAIMLAAASKEIELLGSVPMSADVSTAGRHASPFVEKFPDSDVAVSVRHVVTKLQENHEESKSTLVELGALLVRQLA